MVRSTKQKRILSDALQNINSFFSAEDIHAQVKQHGIGIATIYRFLNEQKKKNILHSYTCDRKQVYSKEQTSHCHFICEKTGKIYHFDIDSIDFLKKKIPGKITSFQLEVKGICNDCQ